MSRSSAVCLDDFVAFCAGATVKTRGAGSLEASDEPLGNARALRDRLIECFDRLTPTHQLVIDLYFGRGMEIADISSLLQTPSDDVRLIWSEALEGLRGAASVQLEGEASHG